MRALPALPSLLAVAAAVAGAAEPIPLAAWDTPPPAMRPVARWWWPGGSVDAAVLRTQLDAIADAGFGAVEIQPLLLGLGDDDVAADPRLRAVGEPPFRAAVAAAVDAAAARGLAVDLTLGSGWPGGLPTATANAERQLVMASVDAHGPSRLDAPLPPVPDQSYRRAVEWVLDVLGPQEPDATRVAVVAGRLGAPRDGVPTLEALRVLPDAVAGDRLTWDVPPGDWRVFVLWETPTGHFVMGGAFPGTAADARVVDHLSARGADALLDGYAVPVLDAAAPGGIRALFVDSPELLGELPFTTAFIADFTARTGYDPTPFLPLLFRTGGESKYGAMLDVFGRLGGPAYVTPDPAQATRVREDYEAVRAALFEERFVGRLLQRAHDRGLRLRLQAHGGWADYLDTYALADVPESEGLFAGGSFDFLTLAASAAHVAGRPIASSESFITIRLWGTRLDDDEMRLLAGRAYAAGLNQLVFHGVPYPYVGQDGAPWYPFRGGFGRILAGPLPMSSRGDAALLATLPPLTRSLARLTVATTRGAPAAEVAWLRTAREFPDAPSIQVRRITPHDGESRPTRALRARGLGHDRVSPRMLAAATVASGRCGIGAGTYGAVLLDPLPVAEPELVERLVTLAEAGVPVVALGALPERAPGLRDAATRDARVREARQRLEPLVVRAPDDVAALEAVLAARVPSGLIEPSPGARLTVSLARRTTPEGDVVLVVNEAWDAADADLRFVRAGGPLVRWDPASGARMVLRDAVAPGDVVRVALAPAASVVLTLGVPTGG